MNKRSTAPIPKRRKRKKRKEKKTKTKNKGGKGSLRHLLVFQDFVLHGMLGAFFFVMMV